jgi:hypothetical protein
MMPAPLPARASPPPPRRDVPVDAYAAWGPECGPMHFFPEGAINVLFSPGDRMFSVKMKYQGFAPDGYCKRASSCTPEGARRATQRAGRPWRHGGRAGWRCNACAARAAATVAVAP